MSARLPFLPDGDAWWLALDASTYAGTVAVLRGRALDRDGNPLKQVKVTIAGHPEYGSTLSRADGMFDLAVNGGGLLTVTYAKTGYLPAQRQVDAPWQDFAQLPDVVLSQDRFLDGARLGDLPRPVEVIGTDGASLVAALRTAAAAA